MSFQFIKFIKEKFVNAAQNIVAGLIAEVPMFLKKPFVFLVPETCRVGIVIGITYFLDVLICFMQNGTP